MLLLSNKQSLKFKKVYIVILFCIHISTDSMQESEERGHIFTVKKAKAFYPPTLNTDQSKQFYSSQFSLVGQLEWPACDRTEHG